jgi:NADPH:quinone reductase-like Zn-dependent oxidoreductase
MAQKNAVIGLVSFLLVAMMLIGGFAMAAELGGKDDPVVSLSYINELMPQINQTIDQAVGAKKDDYLAQLQTKADAAIKAIDQKVADFDAKYTGNTTSDVFVDQVAAAVIEKMGGNTALPSGGGDTPGASVPAAIGAGMVRVVVDSGKTITFAEGAFVMNRLGSGAVVGDAPGLVDLTDGTTLASGGSVKQNHLYTVTIPDYKNGIKAAENMTMFVMGDYKIS